ncbi:MAG: hypothetical protein K8T89_02980 [Planctomycetes bacterium]|nr:hypothetical protein [Planctomycetota bacterium]
MDQNLAPSDPYLNAPSTATDSATTTAPYVNRGRSWGRAFVQVLRRLHLYAGLLMLPWVILYGITAFLFNHPNALSDQPSASFDKDSLAGTPMASLPSPLDVAQQVVAALQERKPDESYSLVEPEKVRYTRDFAFATVKADDKEISVLLEVNGSGGTIRSRNQPPAKPVEEKAPFAVGGGGPSAGAKAKGPSGGGNAGRGAGKSTGGEGLSIDQPLHERVKAAVPVVLEKNGFPLGEVTVTSVPDLTFLMKVSDKIWKVTYNAQNRSVSGRPAVAADAGEPISTRRFLTRLHLAHGYPSEVNSKWGWALIVDAMAFIMLFWGLSGILMWWQLKKTRRLGAVILVLSAVAAVWVGMSMHEVLNAAQQGGAVISGLFEREHSMICGFVRTREFSQVPRPRLAESSRNCVIDAKQDRYFFNSSIRDHPPLTSNRLGVHRIWHRR